MSLEFANMNTHATTPSKIDDWHSEPQLDPKVCEEREFLEIAEDFSNPCELFREAISNSSDAGATEISILLTTLRYGSRDILRIEISDNGNGMSRDDLQAFFDLGNSTSRERDDAIGEKGHGTKIYYKSSAIQVLTAKDGIQYRATVQSPYDALANGKKPSVIISSRPVDPPEHGTTVIIDDYNHSIRDRFTHANLKDYVLWFTKMGSVEREFGIDRQLATTVRLKGIDATEPEVLKFGHVFPEESKNLSKLLDVFGADAPAHLVKKWRHSGVLKNFPDIKWEAVFSLEGDDAKRAVNTMIRGKGRALQTGMYSVQERYGLWLCKDHIPIQRMNEWITIKGSEFTRFHAFVNCQAFRLTANRGSVMNTPPAVFEDIQQAVNEFYRNKIAASTDFTELEWLEGQAAAYINAEKDEKDFEKRVKKLSKRKVAKFKHLEVLEPENEVAVLALVTAITAIDEGALPFRLLDYTTYRGNDALATFSKDDLPLEKLNVGYIEFKHTLQPAFNHLFKHLREIVCWETRVKDGDFVTDVGDNRRGMRIVPGSAKDKKRTRYYLEDPYLPLKIEVFVLKEYLAEELGMIFSHNDSGEMTST